MVRIIIPLIMLLVGLLAGCDGLNEEQSPVEPGALSLASINPVNNTGNVFNLGDLKNTKSFPFYLTNKGDTDIFNVTIESSNPDFIVEPDFIGVLQAGGGLLLEQGLQVTAVHGSSASGLGPAAPMRMGLNETELLIRAQTTDASDDTLSVQTQATMQVNVQLADIELFDINGVVRLDSTTGSIAGAVTTWPLPPLIVADGNLRLVNSGNVDLQIRTYQRRESLEYEEIDSLSVSPTEEIIVERRWETTVISIDTNETVTDPDRLTIYQDGLVYILCDVDRSPPN